MALPNFSFANSSKNVIMTYTCANKAILTIPIIISGTGENKIFNPEFPDIGESLVTLDGVKINYTKPAIVKGTLTLNSQSPALQGINLVLAAQYLSDPISGTFVLADPTGLWTETYQDFTFLSSPVRILNERVEDIDLKWSAYIPNSINLANYAGLLTGL